MESASSDRRGNSSADVVTSCLPRPKAVSKVVVRVSGSDMVTTLLCCFPFGSQNIDVDQPLPLDAGLVSPKAFQRVPCEILNIGIGLPCAKTLFRMGSGPAQFPIPLIHCLNALAAETLEVNFFLTMYSSSSNPGCKFRR